MFKAFSVIAAFFFFSFNAQAFMSSPVVSKICGYQDLSQQEKDDFLKHAFHNFLPANTKRQLALGISNFNISARNGAAEKKKQCKKPLVSKSCEKIKKVAATSFRYNVKLTLEQLKSSFEFYRPALKELFKNCESADRNFDRMMDDFDPSEVILSAIDKGDYDSAQVETGRVASLLDIPLYNEKKNNPILKKNPFSRKKVYELGGSVDCEKSLLGSLGLLDQAHLLTLNFLGKISAQFAPAAPELKTK